jgi:hypothetical protein
MLSTYVYNGTDATEHIDHYLSTMFQREHSPNCSRAIERPCFGLEAANLSNPSIEFSVTQNNNHCAHIVE